ncbi:MAG: hypothetical protein PF441_03820 [Desulfuromusa sp.]|jgi:exopolyphosphatase/guanosine-5'-triphosphate,3'-diphosphate pyrophosphatase|nr:hypothetical protein [Desulfuromusa sp.]
MHAVIDVGSNTIRMLIGECCKGTILPHSYHREMTRLAGDYSASSGLSELGMSKTLATLKSYQNSISSQNVSQIRVVGTAALRRAENRQVFLDMVLAETGLNIEVIEGDEEAQLTTMGVLSVVGPMTNSTVVIDIGGGSTELACIINGQIRLQKSYPLGVVQLCEECFSDAERQQLIDAVFKQFAESIKLIGLTDRPYQLIGTAGTITTLAAIHLQLEKYNASLINNYYLSVNWLNILQQKLKLLSVPEREALIGMEPGRGDLILPGLQILLTLLRQLQLSSLRVSDSGLLEGVLLSLTDG